MSQKEPHIKLDLMVVRLHMATQCVVSLQKISDKFHDKITTNSFLTTA
ncbi:hypothetical protein C942_02705 [Photobacterium marinum]|uniref:Uncharacterized protein n=1 Tax=Photobacterium marinum TaxID=1056511 RepID=L8JID1_9GAMM|nr:hypothetical protein C942_02705 [Photobacterium marinum]